MTSSSVENEVNQREEGIKSKRTLRNTSQAGYTSMYDKNHYNIVK